MINFTRTVPRILNSGKAALRTGLRSGFGGNLSSTSYSSVPGPLKRRVGIALADSSRSVSKFPKNKSSSSAIKIAKQELPNISKTSFYKNMSFLQNNSQPLVGHTIESSFNKSSILGQVASRVYTAKTGMAKTAFQIYLLGVALDKISLLSPSFNRVKEEYLRRAYKKLEEMDPSYRIDDEYDSNVDIASKGKLTSKWVRHLLKVVAAPNKAMAIADIVLTEFLLKDHIKKAYGALNTYMGDGDNFFSVFGAAMEKKLASFDEAVNISILEAQEALESAIAALVDKARTSVLGELDWSEIVNAAVIYQYALKQNANLLLRQAVDSPASLNNIFNNDIISKLEQQAQAGELSADSLDSMFLSKDTDELLKPNIPKPDFTQETPQPFMGYMYKTMQENGPNVIYKIAAQEMQSRTNPDETVGNPIRPSPNRL